MEKMEFSLKKSKSTSCIDVESDPSSDLIYVVPDRIAFFRGSNSSIKTHKSVLEISGAETVSFSGLKRLFSKSSLSIGGPQNENMLIVLKICKLLVHRMYNRSACPLIISFDNCKEYDNLCAYSLSLRAGLLVWRLGWSPEHAVQSLRNLDLSTHNLLMYIIEARQELMADPPAGSSHGAPSRSSMMQQSLSRSIQDPESFSAALDSSTFTQLTLGRDIPNLGKKSPTTPLSIAEETATTTALAWCGGCGVESHLKSCSISRTRA